MNTELFRLAVQGLLRKRRSSLLLFAVLLLSFAFAIISLTVTGSIRKTNEEYRFDTYGVWYGAIPNGWDADEAFLRDQPWLDELGVTKSYGAIQAATSASTSIGVMDEAFLRLGRLGLQDGRFPQNAGEIAMEADLLSALGYDYTLGQEITVTVAVPATARATGAGEQPQKITVPVERTYLLCGVLREYADLWMRGASYLGLPSLNSAMITPDAAEALRQAALEATPTGVTLNSLTPQYYFSVQPGCEGEMKEQGDAYMRSTRPMGGGDRAVFVNGAATLGGEEGSIRGFYAVLILAVTLLAVVCIYAIQIQDEARQLAIFRSIGITKRQLCVMLLYETLCLGVPAMVLGAGCGVLGTWALLRLAVYSGSVPVRVVIPPALLTAAAGLWLLGVLAARLAVFLAALRAPLTGRFHVARKKARRYRNVQRVLIAGLSSLLCATVTFTVLESLGPIRDIRYLHTLADYTVTRKGDYYSPSGQIWFTPSSDGFYLDEDFTVSKDAAAAIDRVPGVAHTWGWGAEYVRLDFDGVQDMPLADALKRFHANLSSAIYSEERLPYGIGPHNPDALAVYLLVVDEGDWEGILAFDIDREQFQSGDAVLLSFCVDTDGKFICNSFYTTTTKLQYEETGLSVGDTIRVTAGTPKAYGTTETRVGGIITHTPIANTGGLSVLSYAYTIICSEAFLDKILDSLGPGEAWNEFRQGTPYGYEQVYVYTDPSAEYLSTDAVLASLCTREELMLDASMREQKQAGLRQDTQSLILLIPGGGCVALVLLLILGNTLSMEAERKKRNFGILQALGMSRRQLRRSRLATALGRSVLAAAMGWMLYGGYCLAYVLRRRREQLAVFGAAQPVQRILAEKFTMITLYWGDWQVVLPLTACCIALVLVVSWLAQRRLAREDLMAKLRDEH